MSSSNLSLRSTRELQGQPNATAKVIADAWKDLYSADKNPNGVINLGVAENALMQDFLVEKLKETFSRLQTHDLNYQSLGGSSSFKDAMCHILNRYFNPVVNVKPSHLLCASGVTAILAQLMYAICDEGDGVLISRPYYSGFNHLIKQGVTLVDFEIENPLDPSSVSKALDKAYLSHQGHPHQIKAVLLCYYVQEGVLSTYIKFCETNKLHLIVDEIYGLSVFEEGPQTDNDDGDPETGPNKFISTLSLDPHRLNFDPSRLHVLYGISKDFACCGLRAGILISQSNPNLLQLIKDLNLNQVQVSSLTEFSFSNLILNNNKAGHDRQDFLASYLKENRIRLSTAHQMVTDSLKQLKISFNNPSNGGFFLMIDLSRYIDSNDDEKETEGGTNNTAEERLFERLLKECKIYIAPGKVYNYPKPGFFRLTFTVPSDQLELGLKRLARFMESFESSAPPISNLSISEKNL
ncbi:hypothetical protein MJO28_002678 [Puccinia striiformis f. sp. tritici]|uniref:Uncharacterized protein n=1 Tax=Puccinia striiformis f. sp. tritici TaxID=168172 RepID=A0ACC0EQI2_9BASI|nr:hypothetical protein MJO28_002678 [Puccinia striiformis f. sp. tritici]KAI7964651.1 hypothetical protein MJO29_002749 [Puccinia striiformis f. sp. tritici]